MVQSTLFIDPHPHLSTAAVVTSPNNDSWACGLEPDLVDGEACNPLENDRTKRSRKQKLDDKTYADLEKHFDKPLGVVAKIFKVSENTLRKHYKKFGISFWPYERNNGVYRLSKRDHNVCKIKRETSFVESDSQVLIAMASEIRSSKTLITKALKGIETKALKGIETLLMQEFDEMEHEDIDVMRYQKTLEALLTQQQDLDGTRYQGIRPLVMQDSDEMQNQDSEYPKKFLFDPPITELQPIMHDEMDEFLFRNINFGDDIIWLE